MPSKQIDKCGSTHAGVVGQQYSNQLLLHTILGSPFVDRMSVLGHTQLQRERLDKGRYPVLGPATSWDTNYNNIQFERYLLSTPEREFLSADNKAGEL
jgi:hypothetical protein